MHPAGINPAGKLLQGFCPMLNQCISAELNLYEAVITIIQVQNSVAFKPGFIPVVIQPSPRVF